MVLVRSIAILHELLLVDSVWSGAVEEVNQAEQPDMKVAHEAAGRMDDLLTQAAEGAEQLRSVLLANTALLAEIAAKIGASDRLSAEQRERWLMHVQLAGGPTELVSSALEHIERESPREREDITAKLTVLAARGSSEGDISAATACNVAAMVAVASAAIDDWPLAFMAGGLAGYYCAQAGPLLRA
ncbi:hypothetical protein [Streptomyces sp. NPDC058294]